MDEKKEPVKYTKTIEEFLESNPGIDKSWADFMRPVVQVADDDIYEFILGAIFQ